MWKVERPNIEKQSKSMESWELLEREQLGVSCQLLKINEFVGLIHALNFQYSLQKAPPLFKKSSSILMRFLGS